MTDFEYGYGIGAGPQLLDLSASLRKHGGAGGWLSQPNIVRNHPLMRRPDGIQLFFTHLNDSWRVHPPTIREILREHPSYVQGLNTSILELGRPILDESQYWARLLTASQWYTSESMRSEEQRKRYRDYISHLADVGSRMLQTGQLWPHIMDQSMRNRCFNEGDSNYLLYDAALQREFNNTLNNSSSFMPDELEKIKNVLAGVEAEQARMLREVWLPEFTTKRECKEATGIADAYLIALYPNLAERYYKRLAARRRRHLHI